MNRIIFFLLVVFAFTTSLWAAGSPYQNYTASDNVLLGVTALGGVTSLYLDHHMSPLTPEQAARLDRQSINRFDRPATYLLSPRSATFSDYGLRAGLVLPIGLMVDQKIRDHAMDVGYLYVETMALTGVVTELTKVTTQRIRPWAYNDDVPLEKKKGREVKKAFFSGHTSATFAGGVFFAKVFSDFYPDSKWKPAVWASSLTLASAVGYWRFRAGRHYPTDVLVGALVGGAIAYYIPELHKSKKSTWSMQPGVDRPMMINVRLSF